jgi:hypothetical protein
MNAGKNSPATPNSSLHSPRKGYQQYDISAYAVCLQKASTQIQLGVLVVLEQKTTIRHKWFYLNYF